MARLTVILDQVVNLSHFNDSGEPNPAKAAALSELAGAGGVAIRIDSKDFTPSHERIIKSIKNISGIPLAVIMAADDKLIDKMLDLKPDMVVLRDYLSASEDYISKLQVANIITAIEIAPELDQVKASAKHKADYVAIDISSFCGEKNMSARIDLLNRIAKAAALAERLSIGVIAAGPITQADLARLAKIEQIEDYFIGHEIISKAVLFGLEKAVGIFKAEISKL
jgi:pyridoxine 5-phosphate synthase